MTQGRGQAKTKLHLLKGSKPIQRRARDLRSAAPGGTEFLLLSVSDEVLFDGSFYIAEMFRQVEVRVYKSFVQLLASFRCPSRILCSPVR